MECLAWSPGDFCRASPRTMKEAFHNYDDHSLVVEYRPALSVHFFLIEVNEKWKDSYTRFARYFERSVPFIEDVGGARGERVSSNSTISPADLKRSTWPSGERLARLRERTQETPSSAMGVGASHQTKLEREFGGIGDGEGQERFFGLENFGNTCYCNSVLQVRNVSFVGVE